MKSKRTVLSLFAIATASCSITMPNIRDTYDPYIRQQNFSPVYPPRENFGAGVVYLVVQADGLSYPRILCDTIFADVKPNESKTQPTTMTFSGSDSIGLGLNILSGLVTSVKSAEANLKATNAKSVAITYQVAVIEDLPTPFTSTGSEIVVSPHCVASLKELKERGQLGSVYVNERALRVDKFGVQVEQERSGSASANVDVKGLLTVKPELKSETKSKNVLEVSTPMYVGVNSRIIKDVVPTYKVGAETWVISTDRAQLPSNFKSGK